MKTLSERFWSMVLKTDNPNDCWIWVGSILPKPSLPYGRIFIQRIGRRNLSDLTHRVSWKLHFGPIPDSMCILHSCDNPKCVNPKHLFLGTRKDNSKDMIKKGRGYWPGNNSGINSYGEARPAHKLGWDQIAEIRQRYSFRKTTMKDLAIKYKVSKTTIFLILHNKAWNLSHKPI